MRRREVTVGQRMREGQRSPSARAICVGMRGDHELCGLLSGGLRSVATGAEDKQGQTKILRLHDAQQDRDKPRQGVVANTLDLFRGGPLADRLVRRACPLALIPSHRLGTQFQRQATHGGLDKGILYPNANHFPLRWIETKHCQHPAGFSFLGAVGVVPSQITRCARAGVVDVLNTWHATLPDDLRSEIDLVVGRANTRTELHDHVYGIRSEAFNHLSDRVCDHAKLGSFAAGVHKANRRCFWIYDVNGATISDVNAERDTALIGNNAIARGEFAAHRAAATAIDHGDVVTVDLFGSEQRPIPKAGRGANFAMCGVEPLQHFGFIVGDVDAGNSLRENVTTDFDRA